MIKEKAGKALAVLRLIKYLRENPGADRVFWELLRDPMGPTSMGKLKKYLRKRGLPSIDVSPLYTVTPGRQFKIALAAALEAAKMYEEGQKREKVEALVQRTPKSLAARLNLSEYYRDVAEHLAQLYDRALERVVRRRRIREEKEYI